MVSPPRKEKSDQKVLSFSVYTKMVRLKQRKEKMLDLDEIY
jgi:hypothetical protein